MALRQDSAAWVALYKEDMGCYFLTLRDTVVGQGSVFGVQIVIMFSAVRLQFFAPHFAFREASLCEEPNEVHNAKTGDAFWVAVSKTDFPSSDFLPTGWRAVVAKHDRRRPLRIRLLRGVFLKSNGVRHVAAPGRKGRSDKDAPPRASQ
jgi:hypothetical protein